MKGIVTPGISPLFSNPKLPKKKQTTSFYHYLMYFWVQTFQFEPHIFQREPPGSRKIPVSNLHRKNQQLAGPDSRPDLKPKRKRFKTGPNKDLKKRIMLTNVSFMIFFLFGPT